MKNLVKNVVRSFKQNKLSIIGLVLLLFFGLGVFCIMSNTTSNIKNEYTSLAKEGNLHDLSVAELYDAGDAQFCAPGTKGITYTVTEDTVTFNKIDDIGVRKIPVNQFYFNDRQAEEYGTFYVPIPEQTYNEKDGKIYVTRTYSISLDDELSTGLYSQYAKDHAGTSFVNFKYIVSQQFDSVDQVPDNVKSLKDILNKWSTSTEDDWKILVNDSVYSKDYHEFSAFVSKKTSSIYSLMTTGNTPLAEYIDKKINNNKEKYAEGVNYRYFKSINVTTSMDNIFYKIIDSNPEDQIDKMVLFKDSSGQYGNSLYSVSDWAPFGSEVKFINLDSGKVIEPGTSISISVPGESEASFIVPGNFNEVAELPLYPSDVMANWSTEAKSVYSQIIQIRFKHMYVGDFEKADNKPTIKTIAAINLDKKEFYNQLFSTSEIKTAYDTYYTSIFIGSKEIVDISANGNVVLTWTSIFGSPTTLTMVNWTSKLAIVNPQHLNETSQRVISPETINEFEPYKKWFYQTYKTNPDLEIDVDAAKSWFNTLNSDQYSWWINPETKQVGWETMTYDLPDGTTLEMTRSTFKDSSHWNGIDKKYIVNCSGYDEIIWGCGLTPDFMYPVVDISRPTPNVKTECLVYTNDSGYNSIKLAFINSTVEEYLIARFKANVNSIQRQNILNDINQWATAGIDGEKPAMIYPEGTKVAFFADDASNVLNCSGFRIAYIPNLVNIVQTTSTILCAFIIVLCLVICFVIIKRYVENNRVNIGIMRANGIKKWKIAFSLFPFALLPAIIGGIGSYIVGLFMQGPMLLLFKDYWMLPTPLFGFDWVSFLVCIFAPFLIFTLICFVSTFIVLRTNAVNLMKNGSEFKTNSFSRIAKKPFKYFGILTRFRVSLAFNSISRLLILAAMSCLTMSSLVFTMTTFDRLAQSKNINSTQFGYDFNIELATPTSAGGPYSTYDYSQPLTVNDQIKGYGWADPEQYLFNVFWNTSDEESIDEPWYTRDGERSYMQFTKPYMSGLIDKNKEKDYKTAINQNGLLMLPSMADAEGQKCDPLYLQNKRSSKLTLDYIIGPTIGQSNPWGIALAMMPANSRNVAAESFNKITNKAGQSVFKDGTVSFVNAARRAGLDVVDTKIGKIMDDGDLATKQKVETAASTVKSKWFKLGHHQAKDEEHQDDPYWYSRYTDFFDDVGNNNYSLITDQNSVCDMTKTKFNIDFISLIITIYQDPELLKMEYPIEYGAIPLNWDLLEEDKKDETYTYINGNIKSLSSHVNYDHSHEIKIEGIKRNSNYIFLTDKNGHSLNEYLWSDNYLQSLGINNEDVFPVIINAFASYKYELGVGSTITINKTNDVTRFNPDPNLNNTIKFKVAAVSAGTNNEAFYTTQDIANDLIGLPNGTSWNRTHKYMMWSRNIKMGWKEENSDRLPSLADLSGGFDGQNWRTDKVGIYHFNDEAHDWEYKVDNVADEWKDKLSKISIPIGFNGIYTHNKTGKPITAGLALYSYAGLYPGTSVFKSQSDENKFTELLMFGPNLAIANLITGINKEEYYVGCQKHLSKTVDDATYRVDCLEPFINEVIEMYGTTTMISTLRGAIDVGSSDLIYSNLISTFNLAETTILSIIIPITIIIVTVISSLIINDSRKMTAMLKALGYSDIKNLTSILALFVPTIVIGVLLSIPLSLGLTVGYQSIIFNSANILVDVTQKWWYYIASIGGVGIILMSAYLFGYVSFRRSRLVDEIK